MCGAGLAVYTLLSTLYCLLQVVSLKITCQPVGVFSRISVKPPLVSPPAWVEGWQKAEGLPREVRWPQVFF